MIKHSYYNNFYDVLITLEHFNLFLHYIGEAPARTDEFGKVLNLSTITYIA